MNSYFKKNDKIKKKCNSIRYRLNNFSSKILFLVTGFAALIWFLIRVIPKPSRASYPCMKVAYPLASGFVTYLLGLWLSIFSYKKFKKNIHNRRLGLALVFMLLTFSGGILLLNQAQKSFAETKVVLASHIPNMPMGTPLGIFPGRVVWVYNPDATNESCDGSIVKDGIIDDKDNLWFQAKNNNLEVIETMVSQSVLSLSGESSYDQAWDNIFHYFNKRKNKGDVGYSEGEIVFIKTNATSAWGEPGKWGMYLNDLSKTESWRPDIAETNPYIVLALLKELVNNAGIPQQYIYVGDPMKQIYKSFYELWHNEFPDINYLGNDVLPNYSSLDIESLGRSPVAKSGQPGIFYSDKGTVLDAIDDTLYTILEKADYLINVPTMKAHARAGITLAAKNHFGSQTRNSAEHLHNGLVSQPPNNDQPVRTDYGMYRVQVDIMGNQYLGANTMLVLVDALYPSDEAVNSPAKWEMAPFNGDWTSSIFLSQDQVAVESVCFDFLRTEYDDTTSYETSRPNWPGVDDYLHQAADSSNWPDSLIYSPNGDGLPIPSLGVHEHWNNPLDKQYSVDLGSGEGIELVKIFGPTAINENNEIISKDFLLKQNYPNPFNGNTLIRFTLGSSSHISLSIYDIIGRKIRSLKEDYMSSGSHSVRWEGKDDYGKPVSSGIYIYRLNVHRNGKHFSSAKQMLYIK
jgi:hypothetical protein